MTSISDHNKQLANKEAKMNGKCDTKEDDCIFIFDNQKLTANQLTLASHSPVFELMFFGPMASSEIEIKDISVEDFQTMLEYMQTQCLVLESVLNAWSLYYIGQKYFIKNLNKMCLQYINCNLTLSTLLLSYEYSQLYNLKDLAKRTWRDILLSAKDVLMLDYHMKASTFCALLDENSINANETDLIKAAIDWAKDECVINELDPINKYTLLCTAGIFQRLRFRSLGSTSFLYIKMLVPNNLKNVIPLISNNAEKRLQMSKAHLGIRYRFRETYKIERNIRLMPECEFSCTFSASCKIVMYGIAVAQPHQGGLVTACSHVEVIIFDNSSKCLYIAEHSIVTQGDYEVPDLVHFEDGVHIESNVPYKIRVRYLSMSKKSNQLLCFYLSDHIVVHRNSVALSFYDDACGGVVRGLSYYVL